MVKKNKPNPKWFRRKKNHKNDTTKPIGKAMDPKKKPWWRTKSKRNNNIFSDEEVERLFAEMCYDYHQKKYHVKKSAYFEESKSCRSSGDNDSILTSSTGFSSMSSLTEMSMKMNDTMTCFMSKMSCCFSGFDD